MTRAHLSSLTAWGPLPTCVVAPRTPINRRAADAESDDGLVLPLRNGKLPRYSAPMRSGRHGITLDILLCLTVHVPGCRTRIEAEHSPPSMPLVEDLSSQS